MWGGHSCPPQREKKQSMNLRDQLESALQGRVCIIGIGNPHYGDDGLGMMLTEEFAEAGVEDIIAAGTIPEAYIGAVCEHEFDHVLFVDAVEFGAEAGSVIFLGTNEIASRFPQVSTHKISVGVLAKYAESNGITRAWLLGVQPASVREGRGLSPKVQETFNLLRELLFRLKNREMLVC